MYSEVLPLLFIYRQQNDTPMKTFRLAGMIGSGRQKDDAAYGVLESASRYLQRQEDRGAGDHGGGGLYAPVRDSSISHGVSGPAGGSDCGKGKDGSGEGKITASPKRVLEEAQGCEGDSASKPPESVQPAPEPGPQTYDL